jgi:RNA polymerase sigma-70 factor (ECF subfamily)
MFTEWGDTAMGHKGGPSLAADADLRIAAGIQSRNDESLRAAIEIHGGAVYGIARRILVDAHLAEEVSQDTFLTLWNHPSRFDPRRGKLRTYLTQIARNKAIDVVRREERRRHKTDDLAAETDVITDVETSSAERVDLVRALMSLTQLQRQALTLAYFGGHTYREVADELGIPSGTAKTRLRDGLIALRASLGAGAVSPA